MFVPKVKRSDSHNHLAYLTKKLFALCTINREMAKMGTTHTLKWNAWSKANKILVECLISGTIDASKRPKEIWESNPEFGRCSLSSFCSASNQNKHSTGTFICSKGEIKHVSLLFA
jgi:hypothetical protein